MGAHLGMLRFIPSHFPTLLGTWNETPGLHFLAHTFASPCLGCEPKVKVVTLQAQGVIDEKWQIEKETFWK
jgi:hypothetical protein